MTALPFSGEPKAAAGPQETWPPVKVGMVCFLISEAAFFSTLIMMYVVYLKQTVSGEPNPARVFRLPEVVLGTACLLSSSVTVHLATRSLRRGSPGGFRLWWGLTILLGALFLLGTAREWADLIGNWGLTLSRNLFGTTYFTLVGFHAAHVTAGQLALGSVLGLALRRQITPQHQTGAEVISWYWHFVDGVWVVVFTVVYIVGR